MAPSANRRSGYSRRAQYSTFFGYIAGVLGAIVGAALLLLSIFNPTLFSSPRVLAAQVVEPVGGATARTRSAGRGVFETIEGYLLAGSRHAKLERELAEAKIQIAQAQAIAQENKRLRQLLNLSERDPELVTVTRLTSSTPASSRRFATIGAGSSDGVKKGMPIRSRLGLVGRVLEVGSSSARVLLITDTQSLVPVLRAKDGIAAFAQGRGDGTLQVRLIDLGINPLEKGDVFVTSGSGGLYSPGIAVGVVTEKTPDGALARVVSNPAATDHVLVDEISVAESAAQLDYDAGGAQ